MNTKTTYTDKAETALPAGPDSKILGHTVGRSEVNFTYLLHFKCMYVEAMRTFFVFSLSAKNKLLHGKQ